MKNKTLLAIILLSLSHFAKADDGFYIGAHYSHQSYNLDFNNRNDYALSLHGIGANFGYQFNDYFATEIRFATGIKGDNLGDSGEVELGNTYSFYLKTTYPLGKIYSMYGLVGLGAGKLNFEGNELSTFRGGNLGIGLTMKLNASLSASIEMLYQDNNSTYDAYEDDLSVLQLGIQYLF